MIAPTLPEAVRLPLQIEVIADPSGGAPPAPAVAVQPPPRPTLPRPTLAAAGLFQGWGPRLR